MEGNAEGHQQEEAPDDRRYKFAFFGLRAVLRKQHLFRPGIQGVQLPIGLIQRLAGASLSVSASDASSPLRTTCISRLLNPLL